MDHVQYNDIFEELKRWLRPIDLYNLVQTCKSYNKLITMKDIKMSTMCEIDASLRAIWGTDFDEFKIACKNSNAKIVGSFITECILGEKWNDDICILVPCNELDNLFDKTAGLYLFQAENYEFGDVNNMRIIEYVFFKLRSISINASANVRKVTYNVNRRNIVLRETKLLKYNVNSNEYISGESSECMRIYKINEIFTKHTNFYPSCMLHRKYRAKGFTFYDRDGIISDRDIWKKMHIDIIKVTPYGNKTAEERLQLLSEQGRGYVYDDHVVASGVGSEKKLYTAYRKPIGSDRYFISCFYNHADCLFRDMYPGVEHLHHIFFGDQTLFVIDTFDKVDDPLLCTYSNSDEEIK
uniref:F-box domain-containing protein n=1 Tax=viral metagenome TaxID=1070528 RepID=A0A6C0CAE7_9ZZZZ